MNQDELTDFIAAIPDLTTHRVMDTDGEFSVKMHSAREVAERVAQALTVTGVLAVPAMTNASMMIIDCPTCGHPEHAERRCRFIFSETVRDDVGIFHKPSGIVTEIITGTCQCEAGRF